MIRSWKTRAVCALFVLGLGLEFVLGTHEAVAKIESPDWSEGVAIPADGRPNPYGIPETDLAPIIRQGRVHALQYPVSVTGALLPYESILRFFQDPTDNPLKRLMKSLFKDLSRFETADDVFKWVGLHEFPDSTGTGDGRGTYEVPDFDGRRPEFRMGMGYVHSPVGEGGVTLSCAMCHSANLFGRRVIGMTNRFPRANRVFIDGKTAISNVPTALFKTWAHPSAEDVRFYERTRVSMRRVGNRLPMTLGLDTSLAQVALSLARRRDDEWATPDARFEARPRTLEGVDLARVAADSKPAVWWNLKYKNRWLSDGSVVSGNPILTNFLWNEIGRGTDLHELDDWMQASDSVIRELTTTVFSSQAPRYTDFFPADSIDPAMARRGESVFTARCAKCHGTYEKRWSLAGAERLPWIEQLETVSVKYPEKTPVMDVGTDPKRYQGMKALEPLNRLAISHREGIVIKPQKGYVPPPLVGIWARWPYFHNNSAPTLCAVLTRHELRPKRYVAGPSDDPERDFDRDCNGYPSEEAAPADWLKDSEFRYDTSREGMSNSGHDERIFLKDGKELLTDQDKQDLIAFLKTL